MLCSIWLTTELVCSECHKPKKCPAVSAMAYANVRRTFDANLRQRHIRRCVASMKLPVIDQRISTGYLLFTPARKMRSDDGAGISSGVDLGSSPNSDEGALITLVEVSA